MHNSSGALMQAYLIAVAPWSQLGKQADLGGL